MPHLTDDQPVRVEPKSVAHELALGDLADTFDVRLTRLPLEHRVGAQRIGADVQFAGVLDDHEPRVDG